MHVTHTGEVDHETAVAGAEAGDVVAAASHGEEKAVFAGEAHGGPCVRGVLAPRDERRSPIDHAVPDVPPILVVGIPRPDQSAVERPLERVDGPWLERSARSVESRHLHAIHEASSVWAGRAPDAGGRRRRTRGRLSCFVRLEYHNEHVNLI